MCYRSLKTSIIPTTAGTEVHSGEYIYLWSHEPAVWLLGLSQALPCPVEKLKPAASDWAPNHKSIQPKWGVDIGPPPCQLLWPWKEDAYPWGSGYPHTEVGCRARVANLSFDRVEPYSIMFVMKRKTSRMTARQNQFKDQWLRCFENKGMAIERYIAAFSFKCIWKSTKRRGHHA